MRRLAAAAAAALVLLLTACAGLPTTGAVHPGRSPVDVEADPDIRFIPDSPQPDASPEDIVSGFIRAGSGSQDGWATARQFLTESFAPEWNPLASVTIDRLTDRSAPSAPVDGVSTVEVTATGIVDAEGSYQPQNGGAATLTFALAEEDGQWRIADAPDGIVLFEEQFRSVFRSASLAYFDPTWQYLVPDVRWFPRTNSATYIARALVDGAPSAWLAGSVATAFPDDVGAATRAVTVSDGVAQVDLDASALSLGQTTLDRMQAQLESSLRSPDITAVQMTANGSPLQARPAATVSTRVDAQSLVELADGRFGFLDGDSVEAVAGLSPAVESVDAVSVQTTADLELAAIRTASGAVVRAAADGTTALLDQRPGLLSPTIDPFGLVWAVPAADPAAVRAYAPAGGTVEVADAWPGATAISAMQVSRDGARIAAAVTVRGRTELWVAGIRRTSDGAEIALGEPNPVAVLSADGAGLAWLDDVTLGVLVRAGGDVSLREQPVGGPGTDLTIPAGVSAVAGGNSSARLLTGGGILYVRQGPTWQQLASEVRVLAVQQGMP
ncbi:MULTISPECIES: LpqB family beta-propeller domain-containing protein [Microbacterium]|uniref:GerMN domain-containing protein n=1 Tax=Microbacterium wangchenii TaxID=2541726 RepID=A0ABX5STD8_9MICO|nr:MULTISPECIES: LpqB family beta-propeller domain-containing protein [Microbacterium]MCK6066813.1 GerMN domain-containing protein [Microbacterium sp. EYE_512]QBR88129.1 hypothetical protein E4K62_05105 [Microbacterium wangchenii]TXK18081.1 hypothetical protein FVP99_05695 [Microbacterium wangchenii]